MPRHQESTVFVAGAGGIGCAVGHALRAGGFDVTFVDSDGRKIAFGNRFGVAAGRAAPLPAKFIPFDAWRPPEAAVVLLCTKCSDNAAVLARLPASSRVIPVQNGFDPGLRGRTVAEGVASFVSECPPGSTHTRLTRPGDLHIGQSGGRGGPDPDVGRLVACLRRHGRFRVKAVPDVLPYKYTKLMYNAAIAPLAAAAGLDNGRLLTLPSARRLFFRLLRENYQILKAAGVPLGTVGPFHPDTVDWILRHPAVARALAWPFSLTLRNTYCSMAGDIQTGRTEVDYFNGHLLALAGGLPVPLNRQVHRLLRRLEHDRAEPDPRWLDELAPVTASAPGGVTAGRQSPPVPATR